MLDSQDRPVLPSDSGIETPGDSQLLGTIKGKRNSVRDASLRKYTKPSRVGDTEPSTEQA